MPKPPVGSERRGAATTSLLDEAPGHPEVALLAAEMAWSRGEREVAIGFWKSARGTRRGRASATAWLAVTELVNGDFEQVIQDRTGFMWFVTEDGLNRLEGAAAGRAGDVGGGDVVEALEASRLLEELEPAGYDSILVLASERASAEEEADANTASTYLMLQDLLPEGAERPNVLIELLDPDNAAGVLELLARLNAQFLS